MGWIWSNTAKTYTDEATGQTIGAAELDALHADFVRQMQDQFRAAAKTLHQNGASPDQWEATLRPIVDRTQAIGYQISRGGANAMTDGDWATVAEGITAQYDYLNAFAQEAGTGQLSEEDAANRAAMYGESGRGAFSRGNAGAWDVSLPEYPPVHNNCKCSWDITDTGDGGVQAYWIASDPCPICADLEAQYSPYSPATGE